MEIDKKKIFLSLENQSVQDNSTERYILFKALLKTNCTSKNTNIVKDSKVIKIFKDCDMPTESQTSFKR